MKLSQLLEELSEKKITGYENDVDIQGVVYDPLRVKPGFMFVAINIYTQLDKIEIPEGHDKVDDAINAGAAVVVLQRDMAVPDSVIKIVVPDSRYALAKLANKFYQFPSKKLKMIGITGTNGKTTTTHIIESILLQKYRTGLIGTLYYKINGKINQSKDTTPEPPDLQDIFTHMVNEKVDYCAMEVSSHGIDFFRVEGLDYDVALFTNLSQDHLDYHKTMDVYLETKKKLFKWLEPDDYAIANIDDAHGQEFLDVSKGKPLSFAVNRAADVMAKDIEFNIKGTKYRLVTPIGEIDIDQKLVGMFNVYNSLGAVAVAISQGMDLETIKRGLESNIRVSGRFELLDKGQPFSVVVDYAHTPDGMEKVLSLADDLKPNRVITVFGCGGDRDKDKRPKMGSVADKYSDVIVLTADNPRNEDPKNIINDIARGINNAETHQVIDRQQAIEFAIKYAQPNDIIMILGKGHETTQTLKTETIHFNDVEVAEAILAN
ncbi:MAG TPA: UDP-N-acetylmuramoyl-L-alanyl-D-glutamate--2,6-diaminopimelate ligase [bacterium]|nr:UDP-N-acetylmuramoyl-L-alanyl-D-glutamate--2,6-diaminopimelate ligase [bacterium]